jgi:hypothetical protein
VDQDKNNHYSQEKQPKIKSREQQAFLMLPGK